MGAPVPATPSLMALERSASTFSGLRPAVPCRSPPGPHPLLLLLPLTSPCLQLFPLHLQKLPAAPTSRPLPLSDPSPLLPGQTSPSRVHPHPLPRKVVFQRAPRGPPAHSPSWGLSAGATVKRGNSWRPRAGCNPPFLGAGAPEAWNFHPGHRDEVTR